MKLIVKKCRLKFTADDLLKIHKLSVSRNCQLDDMLVYMNEAVNMIEIISCFGILNHQNDMRVKRIWDSTEGSLHVLRNIS